MASSRLNLSELTGENGFTISGINPDDYTGTSVSSAGDINGDGFDDIIIGESENAISQVGQTRPGKSYVLFGSANSFAQNIDLSALNGSNGFVLEGGIAASPLGINVSRAGDINGDGLDDLLIGSPYASVGSNDSVDASGQAYVVFGTTEGFSDSVNLPSLDGRDGFVINGVGQSDLLGNSVSQAGDINGDGLDDLIIGTVQANISSETVSIGNYNVQRNYGGESYVIFGSTERFNTDFSIADLNGKNGFAITSNNRDLFKPVVSDAGDINSDGIGDVIIGVRNVDGRFGGVGESYVVFGAAEGFGTSLNVDDLNGSNGFIVSNFEIRNGDIDNFVSRAGDVNGDGISDLAIGAPRANDSSGEAYIIFGTATAFNTNFDLTTLNGSNGFTINAVTEEDVGRLGTAISSAGDINGDGIDDLLIGAPGGGTGQDFGYGRMPSSNPGESYIIFGTSEGFDASLNVAELNGDNGFLIEGIDEGDGAGTAVNSAGDIDGDGLDDLVIGAPFAGPLVTRTGTSSSDGSEYSTTYSNGRGESYIIFGNTAPELDLDGSESGVNFSTIFRGNQPASLSNELNLSDNKDRIVGATVSIKNPTDGETEILTAQTVGTDITAIYDTESGVLTLTGEDTSANYQQVLQTLAYNNTSDEPTTTERIIEFVVDDGAGFSNTSNIATTTLSFEQLNQINGTSNTDRLRGTLDADRIQGFGGNDLITGRTDADRLIGNSGNDQLFGGRDNDILFGNRGDDFLNGGRGNDILRAGQGKDTLFGNQGDDILRGHAEDDLLNGGPGSDRLNGGTGADFLNGSSGDDFLKGGQGDDQLFGGVGDDTLRGGNGIDLLQGGQGNDRLDGGFANDSLIGGAGADQFVLRAGNGNDTILDYQDGVDTLALEGLDFSDLQILQGQEQTTLQIASTEEVLATLVDIQASNINQADFSFELR